MDSDRNDGQSPATGLTGDELRAWILGQTATVSWVELQRAFACGQVIRIDGALDLVETAALVIRDQLDVAVDLLGRGLVRHAGDDEARDWLRRDPRLWAVVVPPWVLVQERSEPAGGAGDDR